MIRKAAATTYRHYVTQSTKNTVPTTLHKELQKALDGLRAKRKFNVETFITYKTEMLNNYMSSSRLSACVVSVSGGIDSAATLALLHKAKEHPNTPIKKILAVSQPIHSTSNSINYAKEHCDQLNVEFVSIDQSEIHTKICEITESAMNYKGGIFARGQLKSYMRTPINYYLAQLLSEQSLPAIVVGTGNFDEDGYLMYYCKCGDGVSDVQLINDLHKSEVVSVARHLNVPENILKAKPSADLWEDQTDEGELGFGYDAVELYTEYLKLDRPHQAELVDNLSRAAKEQFNYFVNAIEVVHKRNAHKANTPLNLNMPISLLP